LKKFRASIDIGSNTVVFLFAHNKKILKRGQFITSLGLDLDKHKKFSDTPMAETMKALKEICTLAKSYNILPEEIIATATEASRVATNGEEFYQKVVDQLGLRVEIIDSDQEAYYSARGVCFDHGRVSFICLDIGGASTEFIKKSTSPESFESISLPIGSVRLMNWKKEGVDKENIAQVLKSFDFNSFISKEIIGVAGTMTSICMMVNKINPFKDSEVNGAKITKSEIEKVYAEIKNLSQSDLLKLYPHLGKRSRVIKEGLEIVMIAMNKTQAEIIEISTRGVCFGTIDGLNY